MKKRRRLKPAIRRYGKGKEAVTMPPDYTGDHGTGTAAAKAGTILEPITHEDGKADPNRRARRRRIEVIDHLTFLSLRQYQAAKEIRDAYCIKERLTSGSPIKEKVDTSGGPDAVIAAKLDAISRWERCIDAVPRHHRQVVEMVCCHNVPVTRLPFPYKVARSDLQGALTCVADRLRY